MGNLERRGYNHKRPLNPIRKPDRCPSSWTSVVMQYSGLPLKAFFVTFFMVAGVACGNDSESVVLAPPPPLPSPTAVPPSPPPEENVDPEFVVFDLPPVIERGKPLIIGDGSVVVSTPRGLQGPPNTAFRVDIRALSEGDAFSTVSFFSPEDAGCRTGDQICTVQEIRFDIGPDAELDDYVIEITVFDSINASATASQNFTIVEPAL